MRSLQDCKSCPIWTSLLAYVDMNVLLPLPVMPITRMKIELCLEETKTSILILNETLKGHDWYYIESLYQ